MRRQLQNSAPCWGIYGGTYDPVHTGHLHLARHAMVSCSLQRMLFVPSFAPPHKATPAASFAHRVAMLEAALADQPGMDISLIEMELSGPSYTAQTVQEIRRRCGLSPRQLFFLIGADSLLDFSRWYQFEAILQNVSLIVMQREILSLGRVHQAISGLDRDFLFLPQDTLAESDSSSQGEQVSWWRWQRPRDGVSITYLHDIALATSSTQVRRALIEQGQAPESLVPDLLPKPVAAYIRAQDLYRRTGHTTSLI